MFTFDRRTIDSSGAFLVGELERLDKTLHAPLSSVTWGRDIDLREDVTIADESSSFTLSNYAASGNPNPKGKNWIGGNATAIAGIALDINKVSLALHLWGMELGYSLPELAAAQQVGRPIDTQKYEGIKLKFQMDTDEMVYVGDADLNVPGLVNNSAITPENVTTKWNASGITPKMILDDINGLIDAVWKQSAYAACPTHLLVPPAAMAALVQPVTTAGSKSILQYVREECLALQINGRPLEINPVKWLSAVGASSSGRMVAYTKDPMYVRFPMVPLTRTPLEYRGVYQLTTYYGKLGEVEFVYPETVGYADGIL